MNALCSWSGGKDCCLALHRARGQGVRIAGLLNFTAASTGRCCFHDVDPALLKLQAELLGIPIVQVPLPDDMTGYEAGFKKAVTGCPGIDTVVFGDIYLDEHKAWCERVCADIGVTALEPLWNGDPRALVDEFTSAGYRAVVVSCQAEKLDSSFIGRPVDRAFRADAEARGVCPCGENGEFHTVVTGGPGFAANIAISAGSPVLKQGFWKYWSMDITGFSREERA